MKLYGFCLSIAYIAHRRHRESTDSLIYIYAQSNPLKCGPSTFRKADRFFGPTTAWIVQNSVDNADVCMLHMRDCPPLLNDSTTGHYNSTFTHSTSLWLAFLASEQQRTDLECGFVVLNSMSRLQNLLELCRKPPKYRHLYILDTQWCSLWCLH